MVHSVCCAMCVQVKQKKNMDVVVNTHLEKWHHKSEVISAHIYRPSHTDAFQVANHYPKLKKQLDMPKLKNTTYLSPEIQNKMIYVIGNKIIQNEIIQEVKEA